MIWSARHTLAQVLTKGELMDYHNFSAVLATVSSILNSHPLSIRTTPDGDYLAISPKDLLLGRGGRTAKNLDKEVAVVMGMEDNDNLAQLQETQARVVDEWRQKWLAQAFCDMVPRAKWKTTQRNVEIGDITLLRYDSKYGLDSWRLVRVTRIKTKEDGLVRTVEVKMRPCHVADAGKPYRVKQPMSIEVGVQRLAVLLPLEEQLPGPPDAANPASMTMLN